MNSIEGQDLENRDAVEEESRKREWGESGRVTDDATNNPQQQHDCCSPRAKRTPKSEKELDPQVQQLKERLKQEIVQLEQENIQLKQGNIQLRLEQENAQLEQERAQLEQENAHLEQERAQIEQENAQLKKEKAQLDQENAQLDQENAQLDQEGSISQLLLATYLEVLPALCAGSGMLGEILPC